MQVAWRVLVVKFELAEPENVVRPITFRVSSDRVAIVLPHPARGREILAHSNHFVLSKCS